MHRNIRTTFGLLLASTVLAGVPSAKAQVYFSDYFNSGASAQWGNQRGDWTVGNGTYYAAAPSNDPLTFSSVPMNLTDFVVDVDINNVADGGIWLRADPQGQNGILLVTGGLGWGVGFRDPLAGSALYWHVVQNGQPGPVLGAVDYLFTPGVSDPHLHVVVQGNTYSVFVNGASAPTTTLYNALFASGQVGLYDFSQQTFDNFTVAAIPEPSTMALALAALGILAGLGGKIRNFPRGS